MTLLEEIKNGESATLEFKEERPKDSLKFTKTVVAFANGRGGRILFGVEDGTGVVKGVDNAIVLKEMDAIADTIANCCTPPVMPEITIANIESKSVIVVNVRGGLNTPYYVRKLGIQNGTFQRVGATTREVEEYTLKSLILDGENKSFDRQVAKGVKMSKREISSVCRLMTETARQNCLERGEDVSIKAMNAMRLESMGLLVDADGEKVPSYALCIVAGKTAPGIILPKIRCGVFRGTTKGDFEDYADFDGPLTDQIEQAFRFVQRNLHVRTRLTDKNAGRMDIYELPLESVREAICNAAFHRNYLEPSNVYVALFDDRLEIVSPGGLLKEISIEEVRLGYSKIRNKGLADALVYMHEVESWGGGVARYYKKCAELGLPPPIAEERNGFFTVVFWRPKESATELEKVSIDSKKVSIDSQKVAIDAPTASFNAKKVSICDDNGFIDEGKVSIEGIKRAIGVDTFSSPTWKHIHLMAQALANSESFRKADAAKVLPLKSAAVTRLLRKMLAKGILIPVVGHGKGAYRFAAVILATATC